MKISIASDHAGFEQKQQLAAYLKGEGHEVIDRGPDSDNRVDYPDFAVKVGEDVQSGAAERGVLVCGTGIGMAMAVGKMEGIRAANVVRRDFAVLCRELMTPTSLRFPVVSFPWKTTKAFWMPLLPRNSPVDAMLAALRRSMRSTKAFIS